MSFRHVYELKQSTLKPHLSLINNKVHFYTPSGSSIRHALQYVVQTLPYSLTQPVLKTTKGEREGLKVKGAING